MREETIREVEQFLYREARLLDERRFHEWLELFTDDVRYWMAGRRNRYPKTSKAIAILDPDRYVDEDLTEDDELAILDENKHTLEARVARLDTGMAWAEDPPHRAPATSSPISRSSRATRHRKSRFTPISSCIGAAPRPSRISTSVQDGMFCGCATARGRSRAAN